MASTSANAKLTRAVSPPKDQDRSATEAVFDALLKDIAGGVFGPGARLPSERELSRRLGASRPTVREALRRLAEWRLIDARRGSGIVVRAQREWTIEVLPAFLRTGARGVDIVQLVSDLLALRRTMIAEIIGLVAPRVPAEGVAAGRAAATRAWAARHDQPTFVSEDFGVMRALIEGAGFMPAVWMLNRLSGVYLDLARSISLPPPRDYLEAHDAMFDALDRGDGDDARRIISDYFDRHDSRLVGALEALR